MQRFFIIFFLLFACQAEPQKSSENNTIQKQALTSSEKRLKTLTKPRSSHIFEITTLQSASGWGYQIRQNGKLLLDQPNIPGRPGNAGFQSQADAQRVAELVKTKLQAKVFPPTVSEDDLKNLNIH
ncbi:MAG: DUF4907 domain-containing protein [Crocinitomicaceae bacterium]|nr:DUF4907 domain-containing protein [Crocinitomicaceae bacterium]